MVASVDCDINAFLTEIDLSVQQSRSVYDQLDNTLLPLSEKQWQHVYYKVRIMFRYKVGLKHGSRFSNIN